MYYTYVTKKLTITIADDVYEGLYAKVGAGKIGRFLERLARPHVVGAALDEAYGRAALEDNLEAAYREASGDEPAEAEALEWLESGVDDGLPNEPAA